MKKGKLLWRIGLTLAVAGALIFYFFIKPRLDAEKVSYTFTQLEKGEIESNISSTGTLEAINTIQVGTQISGTISKIFVDYNDEVKAGQLLAEMDIRLLNTSLRNAQANLAVVKARLNQAADEYNRNKALYEKHVITEKEYKDSKYSYDQGISNQKAADASVKSAEVNVGYAHIKSPIAGTIIERTVEEGQTVAASFATPTLFVIAEDLSKMQILADVDESDIGYISKGMEVRFTVQTYPDKKFYGAVSEIRLQPVRTNNVVNYKVVVGVNNEKRLLLPGMTANLDFILASSKNVLLINNTGLRFYPSEKILKEIKPLLKQKAEGLPDSIRSPFLALLEKEEVFANGGFRKVLPQKVSGFFFLNDKQKLDFDFVQLGITTGLESEITSFLTGKALPPDTKVINGTKFRPK